MGTAAMRFVFATHDDVVPIFELYLLFFRVGCVGLRLRLWFWLSGLAFGLKNNTGREPVLRASLGTTNPTSRAQGPKPVEAILLCCFETQEHQPGEANPIEVAL